MDGLLTKYGEAKLLQMVRKKYRGVATPAPRAAPEPAAPTRPAVPVDFDGPSGAKKKKKTQKTQKTSSWTREEENKTKTTTKWAQTQKTKMLPVIGMNRRVIRDARRAIMKPRR